MSDLVRKEKKFIQLLIHTEWKQQKALIGTITISQMQALVQIIYNILHGIVNVKEEDIKQMKRDKSFIREFVAKRVSLKRRKFLLLKYFRSILVLLKVCEKELWLKS